MLSKLYWFYSRSIGFDSFFFKFFRFFLKKLYNHIAVVYYRNSTKKLTGKDNVIISLTTFPDRIDKTWLVIESLIDQSYPADKIVLTLSLKQFKNGILDLPKELVSQIDRGLEIIWTNDDLRSHKKYFYSMQKYPNSNIITVDDDFLYSHQMIECLMEYHHNYPEMVICHLAAKKQGLSYKQWKNMLFLSSEPTNEIMQYGGSGVLYPPNSLYKDAFDKSKILDLCPLADDIWLNCMVIQNNKSIVKTNYSYYLMPLTLKSTIALKNINVGEDLNSVQIKKLKDYYMNYP